MVTVIMRVYRAYISVDPRKRAHALALRLHARLQTFGTRQVRFYAGKFLTYPFPAPRGYGTRGLFVGIYSASVAPEWLEEDLLRILLGEAS